MIFLVFVFLLKISTANAANSDQEVHHVIESGGVEYFVKGIQTKQDDIWGIRPIPNSRTEITKVKEGKQISKTVSTVDQYGFRVNSAAHLPGKTKHLFLMGSSFVFGEGESDDQTLSYWIDKRSHIYEAYPIAYYAFGPQHTWLRFAEKKLPEQVTERKGRGLIFTHDDDILRFLGATEHLEYASRFPYLVEESPGHFKYKGRFDNAGSLWQRAISKFCVPFLACRTLLTKDRVLPTEAQYAQAARLFAEIEAMYRSQFDVEDFKIVWMGGDPATLKIFKKYAKSEVIVLDVNDRYEDGHPTPKGIQSAVNFLFDSKLVE